MLYDGSMDRRYTKAILIGAVVGIYGIACTACFPDSPLQLFPYDGRMYIPLWDAFQNTLPRGERLDLQYTAVFYRFCLIFLEHGFYFLAVPILFSCGMAKLNEINDPYSELVCLRRAIKLTGLIMLSFYLLAILLMAWSLLTPGILPTMRLDVEFLKMIAFLWEGTKIALLCGPAWFFLFFSFMLHMYLMAYKSEEKAQT